MEKRSSAEENKEHCHAHWLLSFFPGDLEPQPDHLLAMRQLISYLAHTSPSIVSRPPGYETTHSLPTLLILAL